MKVKDVLGSYRAFTVLSQSKLRMSTAFKLGRIHSLLKNEFDEFEKAKQQKVKDYGLSNIVDNNGVLHFEKDVSPEDKTKLTELFKLLLKEINAEGEQESTFIPPTEKICINILRTSPSKEFPEGQEIDIEEAVMYQLNWMFIE